MSSRYPDGWYLLVNVAGMVRPNSGKTPVYPTWLRTYLIVLVSAVWSGMLIASAFFDQVNVPAAVHVIMGVGMASLFSVEFGGIRLVRKEDRDDDPGT